MLQISPPGGGHCIEVPNGDVVADQRIADGGVQQRAAQTFIYDPAAMHLTIGGLCVDAAGGKPGDLVKLSACAAGANQSWKSEPKGNFTKLVGGAASASTSATAPRNRSAGAELELRRQRAQPALDISAGVGGPLKGCHHRGLSR